MFQRTSFKIDFPRTAAKAVRLWHNPAVRTAAAILFVVIVQSSIVFFFRQYQAKVYIQSFTRMIDRGNSSGAEAMGSKAVSLSPYDGYAHFHHGTSLYLQSRFDDAIPVLEAAIPLLPHAYNAVRLLSFSQYREGRHLESAANLIDYIHMNPAPAITPDFVFRMAGLSLMRLGRLAEAQYYLTEATHYNQEKGEILRVRAMIAVLLNQPLTADYCYRSFNFSSPNTSFKPLELVSNAITSNKLSGAIQFLQRIHSSNPDDYTILTSLATAYMRYNSPEKAIRLMDAAVENDPDNPELLLVQGDILYAQRQYQRAFNSYDRHLLLQPDSQYRSDILQKKATSR